MPYALAKPPARFSGLSGVIAAAAFVVSCTETSPGPETPTSPVPNTQPAAPQGPDFSAIQAAVEANDVADMAVLIGNADEVLYRYEKGTFLASEPVAVASASKLVFGLLAWLEVERGAVSLTTRPQDVITFWTAEAADARSQITFDMLLAFTSGLNATPTDPSCVADPLITLSACVERIYNEGVLTPPGTAFFYGPKHMQTAALMLEQASGQSIDQRLIEVLTGPLGISDTLRYPARFGENPRFSGSLEASADAYAAVLAALLKGDLIADQGGFLTNRPAGAALASVPSAISTAGLDWRYGFGFWIECDAPAFNAACEDEPTISSTGAFGFTPWIDFASGYWAIIAMEEPVTFSSNPAAASILLEQQLQPLIEAALPNSTN